MNSKTIFIIVATTIVTIILMKNTDEVNFWIFGNYSVPKLAVLGVMFGTGLIVGYLAGRPKKVKKEISTDSTIVPNQQNHLEAGDDWVDPNEDYIN